MSTSNLKISIAALSLCVSAVAIYIHLPYVIAAVSGSGAIEVVPLAIFTVSAIVALASAIYLIRLAAGEKPAKQESQTEVDSGTSSQHKSSVPTSPSQSPQTCDSVLPPPPPPPAPNSNGTSLPKLDAFLKEIEQGMKLISKEERDERLKEQAAKKSSNKGDGQKEKNEDLITGLSIVLQKRRAGINGKQNNIVQQSNNLEGVYDKISNMIPLPRSRSNSVSSDSSNVSDDEDWDTHSDPVVQEPSGSKSFHREKSKSPDSGIGSRAASPLEEPPVPPSSCVDLPSTAQVNNVNPVNSGVQNSPITETPVDTKEQNNSGSAGSYTNERDNELGLDSDAENESKERAARIEREQAERREKQEKVNSKMQDPSALSIKEKAKMFGNWW